MVEDALHRALFGQRSPIVRIVGVCGRKGFARTVALRSLGCVRVEAGARGFRLVVLLRGSRWCTWDFNAASCGAEVRQLPELLLAFADVDSALESSRGGEGRKEHAKHLNHRHVSFSVRSENEAVAFYSFGTDRRVCG